MPLPIPELIKAPLGAASSKPLGAASSKPLGAASSKPLGAASSKPPGSAPAKPLDAEPVKSKDEKPPVTSSASVPSMVKPWQGKASNQKDPMTANTGGVGYWLNQGQQLLGRSADPKSSTPPAQPSTTAQLAKPSETTGPSSSTMTPDSRSSNLFQQARSFLMGRPEDKPPEPEPQPNDLKAATVIGQTGDIHQSTSLDGKTARERVYILHSGMNDPTNTVALRMRQELLDRKIPDERILILNNRYPSFNQDGGTMGNFKQFGRFANPKAKDSGEAYDEMQEAIKARGFDPDNTAVTFIAHSGGGQAVLGIAEVDKAKQTPQVERIITLGSPLARNGADPNVALTHFVSDEDPIHFVATSAAGRLAGALYFGRTPREFPTNLDGNDQVVRTTHLDHHGYFTHRPTMDRVASTAIGQPLRTEAAEVLPFLVGPAAIAVDGSQPLQTKARAFHFTGPKEAPSFMGSLLKHFGY